MAFANYIRYDLLASRTSRLNYRGRYPPKTLKRIRLKTLFILTGLVAVLTASTVSHRQAQQHVDYLDELVVMSLAELESEILERTRAASIRGVVPITLEHKIEKKRGGLINGPTRTARILKLDLSLIHI